MTTSSSPRAGWTTRQLRAQGVGVHDLTGAVVQAELAPSSELPLHLAVYAAFDHQVVVHTHAVASTALSVLVDEVPASHYDTALFGGGVRVAPYATFGTEQLARNVTAALQQRSAALMGNHGAALVGADLAKLLGQLASLEYLGDVQLRVLSTGLMPRLLDEAEIDRVREGLAGYGQQPRR